VGEFAPAARHEEGHQIAFHFDWIGVPREPHPLGQPRNMRVDHHALLHAEGVPKHDIRGLARDATQCQQRVHAAWYLTAEVALESLRGLNDGTRLVAPEVDGANIRFDVRGGGRRKCRDRWKRSEERWSRFVHGGIGRLCRKDGGDQEFMRAVGLKCALRLWVASPQCREQLRSSLALRCCLSCWGSLCGHGTQWKTIAFQSMLSAIRLMPPLAATLAPLGDDPIDGLEVLRSIGFRAVQLSATQPGMRPRELDASARRDLIVRLRRLEMRCAGLDVWIPPEHFASPTHAERAVDALRQAVGMAADLGRVSVSTALPVLTDANAQILRDVRAQISGTAAHAGVEVADHGSDAVTGAWEATADDPIGVGIDPAMLLSLGHDPVASVARCGQRLRAARVVDMLQSGMRAPPGEADGARLQLGEYVLALAGAGFQRSPVADARHWAQPRMGLERVRALWPEEHGS